MAKEYLLMGIGGTGARVLEAFTYLSAAGVLGGVSKVHMRMIDMDNKCGNLTRLNSALENYSKALPLLQRSLAGTEWIPREIVYNNFFWDVSCGNEDTLKKRFNPSVNETSGNLRGNENIGLLNGLYDSDDQSKELGVGCRGLPRIGALEFAKRFSDDFEVIDSFFTQLFGTSGIQEAVNRGELRVMLVGSVFGGSGASGVPILANLLRSKRLADGRELCGGDNKIGITLMAPFYSYVYSDNIESKGNSKSEDFLINTKAALLYYGQAEMMDNINSVYVIGGEMRGMRDKNNKDVDVVPGNEKQSNPAMPELLVAALSVLDFFIADTERLTDPTKRIVFADGNGKNSWERYPYWDELKRGLYRLQRMMLMWRLVGNAASSADQRAWKLLIGKYGKISIFGDGDGAFFRETEALRHFLMEDGVEGFLSELEYNGMQSILNLKREETRIDDCSPLRARLTGEVRGVTIAQLVKTLMTSNSGLHLLRGDGIQQRAQFLSAIGKASAN